MDVEDIIKACTERNAESELALQTVMRNAAANAEDIMAAAGLVENAPGGAVLALRNEGFQIAGDAAELHQRYLDWHKAQTELAGKVTGHKPEGGYAELGGGR